MKSAQYHHKITLAFEECLKLGVSAHRGIAVVERADKKLLDFLLGFGFWSLHLGKMISLSPHH